MRLELFLQSALVLPIAFALLLCAYPATPDSVSIFTDITAEAGINWHHVSGESPDRFLIETMGGGVGFLDFDHDGLQDIFFVNGGETPHGKTSTPVRNALYRNLGNGKFEDVTAKAGVDRLDFYGMGVAVGDYDNDDYPDLFVTGFPRNTLFHNNRNGTFTEVSRQAGIRNQDRWAASAAWFDYDRDGYLDLVVANYVQFSFANPKKCEVNGARSYCEQVAYQGMPLTLYHNGRNGTFTDVSAQSGFDKFVGRALGVIAIDVNDDGWTDLFIARDASPNLLLVNKHNGSFDDVAVDAEVAYDQNGTAKAGMGVDAGDWNGDGLPDFVVTNFNDQCHSLLVGSKSALYDDRTISSGLAGLTKTYVGWGTKFVDFDNDGNLDLVFVNGHINSVIESTRVDVKYEEPPLLLRNDSRGRFENMRGRAGSVFNSAYLGRGLAVGDFDNDGDLDLVLTRLNGYPVLLRNNIGQQNSWIGFELEGTSSNRDAIGAQLTLISGNRRLVRWITGGSSYLSAHDRRVTIGLGVSPRNNVNVEIIWPDGSLQTLSNLEVGRYHKVTQSRRK
jgi:hypothetical protein